MIDLAVAVIIGTAFGAVVNSLVKNMLMPVLSYLLPSQEGYRGWHIGRVEIGTFISEVINFLIISLAVFIMVVKILGSLVKKAVQEPAPGEPTTKECPYCLSMIPFKASRCTLYVGPARRRQDCRVMEEGSRIIHHGDTEITERGRKISYDLYRTTDRCLTKSMPHEIA